MKYLVALALILSNTLTAQGDENEKYWSPCQKAKYFKEGEVLEWQMKGPFLDLSHVKLDKYGYKSLAECHWIKGVRISGRSDDVTELITAGLSISNLAEIEITDVILHPAIFVLFPRVETLRSLKLENVGIAHDDTSKWKGLEETVQRLHQLTLLGCDGIPDSFLFRISQIHERHSNLRVEIGTVDHGKTGSDIKTFLRGNRFVTIHCQEGTFDTSPRSIKLPLEERDN